MLDNDFTESIRMPRNGYNAKSASGNVGLPSRHVELVTDSSNHENNRESTASNTDIKNKLPVEKIGGSSIG